MRWSLRPWSTDGGRAELDLLGPVFYVSLALSAVVAIVSHEVSHGVVALWMGDRTAKDAGRLSANPLRHVDPFGTLLLPGILVAAAALGYGSGVVFGYAKPVPIDDSKLSNPRHQLLGIALAGPATNILLAVLGGLVLRMAGLLQSTVLLQVALPWVLVNVSLAAFNMLPLPPLDGSEIVAWLLPGKARAVFRSAKGLAMPVLLAVVLLFPGFLFRLVDPVIGWLLNTIVG